MELKINIYDESLCRLYLENDDVTSYFNIETIADKLSIHYEDLKDIITRCNVSISKVSIHSTVVWSYDRNNMEKLIEELQPWIVMKNLMV